MSKVELFYDYKMPEALTKTHDHVVEVSLVI